MAPPRAIPRELERYPLGAKLAGAIDRWDASDRERGREVVVSRVPFGPEAREKRDAFVAQVRALYTVTHPALIAALDAGAWDDDAFVVEERVIEPRPISAGVVRGADPTQLRRPGEPGTPVEIGEAELDPREKALAARAIAEGLATLHDAGWTLDELDVVIDAYRQPKIAMATRVGPKTEAREAADVAALARIVEQLTPGAASAASARAIARGIAIPEPGPSTPLVHASAPSRTPLVGVLLLLAVLVLIAVVLASR